MHFVDGGCCSDDNVWFHRLLLASRDDDGGQLEPKSPGKRKPTQAVDGFAGMACAGSGEYRRGHAKQGVEHQNGSSPSRAFARSRVGNGIHGIIQNTSFKHYAATRSLTQQRI